jgi:hypothetical protein
MAATQNYKMGATSRLWIYCLRGFVIIGFERRGTFLTALQPTENDMSPTLYMHFDLMTVYRKPVGKRPLARPRSGWQMQGDSNMTGTDLCVNKPHKSRSYLNHLVI